VYRRGHCDRIQTKITFSDSLSVANNNNITNGVKPHSKTIVSAINSYRPPRHRCRKRTLRRKRLFTKTPTSTGNYAAAAVRYRTIYVCVCVCVYCFTVVFARSYIGHALEIGRARAIIYYRVPVCSRVRVKRSCPTTLPRAPLARPTAGAPLRDRIPKYTAAAERIETGRSVL